MIDVTVKTLDSNVYHFTVNEEATVKDFKEQIATEVNVPWDKQRIIFCGKVLQDEKKLAECNVHGKTVHLVQRLPQFANQPNMSGASSSNQSNTPGSTRAAHFRFPMPGRGTGNVFVEAIAMPTDTNVVQGENLGQIIRQVVSSISNLIPNEIPLRLPSETAQTNATGEGPSVHSRLLVIRLLMRLAYNGIRALESPSQQPEAPDNEETLRRSAEADTLRDPNRPFSSLSAEDIRGNERLTSLLATVYQEMETLQGRLQPFVSQYRTLLSSENITPEQLNEEGTRRLSNRVSEITHSVSHINHLLSDLEIDTRNPRNLVVRGGHSPMAVQVSVNSMSLDIPLHAAAASALSDLSSQTGNPPQTATPTQRDPIVPETPPAAATTESTATAPSASESTTSNSTRTQPVTTTTTQRFAFLYPSRFVRRLSNATSRSVVRMRSPPATTTPSREETTVSNTTTGTTDTTTTAGSNINREGASPNPGTGLPAGFSISSPSSITLRPSPVVREILDPYLICDSAWSRRSQPSVRATTTRSTESTPRSSNSQASSLTSPDSDGSLSEYLTRNAESIFRTLFPGLESLTTSPLTVLFNDLFANSGISGENIFLMNLLGALAAQLTIGDLLQMMISRDYDRLNRLRQPFREQLNTGLLNNAPYSEETMEREVNRVVDECMNQFEHDDSATNPALPNVDYLATMSAFLKDNLSKLFTFVLTSPEDTAFGEQLLNMLYDLIMNFFSLLSLCRTDSGQSFMSSMSSRMGVENNLVSDLFRRAMADSTDENSRLRQYIRTRDAPTSSAPFEAMEIDISCTSAFTVSGAPPGATQDIPATRPRTSPEDAVSHASALEALRAAVPPTSAPTSGGSWVSGVPVGWAPIIARDVTTQNGQQRPLSDAYLEGMPSKRRRIMKPANPSRLSNVTASLQEAIQRAGVRPRTSTDAFFAEIEQNRIDLQNALQRSIRDRLARRLTEDRDFESEKFPNAKRMTE